MGRYAAIIFFSLFLIAGCGKEPKKIFGYRGVTFLADAPCEGIVGDDTHRMIRAMDKASDVTGEDRFSGFDIEYISRFVYPHQCPPSGSAGCYHVAEKKAYINCYLDPVVWEQATAHETGHFYLIEILGISEDAPENEEHAHPIWGSL